MEKQGGGISSILADKTQLLGSITSTSQTYVAQEDCIMVGNLYGTSANSANLTVYDKDGNELGILLYTFSQNSSPTTNCMVGYQNENIGIFIPKGYQILSSTTGTYNIKFYKVAT